MEIAKNILIIVSALFPVVNPLGASPIFLVWTKDCSSSMRKALSRRIAMNSFFLLVGSYLIGSHILAFFGISLPVVEVGGGLIVVSTGWAILKQHDEEEGDKANRTVQPHDPFRDAFYPLTLPLTVGPGSISVAITLGADAAHDSGVNVLAVLVAIVGSAVLALCIFLCYGFADRLANILGATAMSVIMRLAAFLLVCIGVQIIWNGASALLASIPLNIR